MRLSLFAGAVTLALPCLLSAQSGPADDLWVVTDRIGRIDRFGTPLPLSPSAGFPSPFVVRRAPDGDVWVVPNRILGIVERYDRDGVRQAVFPLLGRPTEVVVDARGHAWIASAGGIVVERTRAGSVGVALALPGTVSAGAVDETGRLWFGVDGTPNAQVSWRDSGTVVQSAGLPVSIGRVVDLVVDGRAGGSHAWIAGDSSAEVIGVDRNGATVATWTVGDDPAPGFRQLALAPDGTLRVAADSGLWSLDPTTGAFRNLVPAASTSVAFDAKGDLWAVVQGRLWKLTPDGALDFDAGLSGATSCDDGAGLTLARVVVPAADSDGDGTANRDEVLGGTNPYDALSLPALDVDVARFRVPVGTDAELVASGDVGWGLVVFAPGRLTSPVTIPGFDGELRLQSPIPASEPMLVPGTLRLRVPASLSAYDPAWLQVVRVPLNARPRISEFTGLWPSAVTPLAVVERFDADLQLDADRSSGRWAAGLAEPGALGGTGRLGSFDPTVGRLVAVNTFEFDTVGQVFPARVTLFGRNETVHDGVFDFTDFVVPAGVTVRFVGDRPAVVRVRGTARVDGTVDVGGADVPGGFDGRSPFVRPGQPPVSAPGQAGAAGGPGGGSGGRGGDGCLGLGTGNGAFDGRPGEDLVVPMLSGYAGAVAGTGGRGATVWPADGLRSSITFNLFFAITGQLGSGGGGGGYLAAGAPGRALRTFTIASDLQPDTSGGIAVAFRPAPAATSALDHYLLGGSGGGGGGSHPVNMTRNEIFGTPAAGPTGWHAGAGGSGGGGALAFRVGGDLLVGAQGALDATGGDGAGYFSQTLGPPSPGGGGSGGTVLLQVDRAMAQGGTIELSGGTGGQLRHVQFNGQIAESVGGDGAPGTVRLERPNGAAVADLGTVNGPASLGAENVGTLRDSDAWTGQVSRWYGTSGAAAPLWAHYTMRVLVSGAAVDYSDDPASYNPATGPGVPVQLWVQGASLDASGRPVGAPGPWRPFVADLDLDRANGFRFMLLYDRSVARDVAVDELRVTFAR